jgi:hypothetical protein
MQCPNRRVPGIMRALRVRLEWHYLKQLNDPRRSRGLAFMSYTIYP